jgi:phage terminase large subunit-like protein
VSVPAKPMKLRGFQSEIILGSYALGIRSALVSLPRANGKSALAAALAVAGLFVEPASAEALVVASDQRRANIDLPMAKRMIALPADPAALHGWDPSLLIVDELHVVTEAVWEAVTSATGSS